jgi:hypothetical protein
LTVYYIDKVFMMNLSTLGCFTHSLPTSASYSWQQGDEGS